MKKIFREKFFLKAYLWSFFCLGLTPLCNLFNVTLNNLFNDKRSDVLQIIQTINISQRRYAETHQSNYAQNFYELVREDYLDEKFAKQYPFIDDYVFIMQVAAPTKEKPAFFSIRAEPYFEYRAWHFYFDSTLGAVKVTDENRPAKPDDPAI